MVAFAHVAADCLRSVTTLTESVLIAYFKLDGTRTDAWACVIVSTIILLGVFLPLWEWLKTVRSVLCPSLLSKSRADEDNYRPGCPVDKDCCHDKVDVC